MGCPVRPFAVTVAYFPMQVIDINCAPAFHGRSCSSQVQTTFSDGGYMLKQRHIYKLVIIGLIITPAIALAAPAPLAKTGQTTSYVAGDDGYYQTGQAWPTPRFSDNGNQTVTDNLTGIIWTKSANAPGPAECGPATTKTWQGALDYVKCLNNNNYLGYSDWFLPNRKEMTSLVNIGQVNPGSWLASQGFTDVQTGMQLYYWTSTTYAMTPSQAFLVNMYYGNTPAFDYGLDTKANKYYNVWPARFVNPSAPLAKTGQTTSYASRDDGELQTGVAWPAIRFTDNGDQTITDNLTGLVWTKSANAPGPETCGPSVAKTWQGALDHVACLNSTNYLGHNDWRLPNRKEMTSLVNIQQANPGSWLASQGFTDVQTGILLFYWTSTTYAMTPSQAFLVNMYYGNTPAYYYGLDTKANKYYSVWPVR